MTNQEKKESLEECAADMKAMVPVYERLGMHIDAAEAADMAKEAQRQLRALVAQELDALLDL